MRTPHAVDIDSQGRLIVGDRGNNRLQIFERDGTYIGELRQFGRPSGIYITDDDTIYIADSSASRRGSSKARPRKEIPTGSQVPVNPAGTMSSGKPVRLAYRVGEWPPPGPRSLEVDTTGPTHRFQKGLDHPVDVGVLPEKVPGDPDPCAVQSSGVECPCSLPGPRIDNEDRVERRAPIVIRLDTRLIQIDQLLRCQRSGRERRIQVLDTRRGDIDGLCDSGGSQTETDRGDQTEEPVMCVSTDDSAPEREWGMANRRTRDFPIDAPLAVILQCGPC